MSSRSSAPFPEFGFVLHSDDDVAKADERAGKRFVFGVLVQEELPRAVRTARHDYRSSAVFVTFVELVSSES